MYKITNYTKDKANEMNIKIKPSKKGKYKIDLFSNDDKYITSIGHIDYKDYPTYQIEKGLEYANERRTLYKKRHEKNRNIKGSRGYYADKLLW